ncbi:MAG TPA: hypothetical protein VHT91_48090 [Kofleriaceae bacterium]|jgi:hypothetical protein|nr:hypothetical protein [Kofleriaceae bacterium]
MLNRLIMIVVGVAAGIAGAVVVTTRAPQAETPSPRVASDPLRGHEARAVPAPAPIIPPGWDRRYLERMNELEDKVQALEGRVAPTEREQEKRAHYERELATQEARLADHDREEVDAAWSSTGAERLRSAADKVGVVARAVDCRSRTCVASLRFPSPEAGLTFLRSPQMSKLLVGFSSMTSTPTPPTSPGDYDLSVVIDR